MVGVENDQRAGKNLMRLVDVFNFVALTSMFATLLLALIKDNTSLRIAIKAALSLLVYLLTIFNGPTWIFPAEFMFVILLHVLPITIETLAAMLLLSSILLVIYLICLVSLMFAGILVFWKTVFPGTDLLWMILVDLIIVLINGCAGLFEWMILKEVRSTLGFMLVGFLGFLGSVCCVYRLVYKWKEYRRAASAVVSSVTTTTATKAAV